MDQKMVINETRNPVFQRPSVLYKIGELIVVLYIQTSQWCRIHWG